MVRFPTQHWQDQPVYLDWGSEWLKYQIGTKPVQQLSSCVAYHPQRQQVVAWGDQAKSFEDRLPGKLQVAWPVQAGVIADSESAELLAHSWWQSWKHSGLWPSTLKLVVPEAASPAERAVFGQVLAAAGVRKVVVVGSAAAAAKSLELQFGPQSTRLILSVGTTTSELIAVVAGRVVRTHRLRLGADAITHQIQQSIALHQQCLIGWPTAQSIQWSLAHVPSRQKTSRSGAVMTVRGKHALEHVPMTISFASHMIETVVAEWANQVVTGIQQFWETLPKATAAELHQGGMWLIGGGVQLHGLREYLYQELGCEVVTAQRPRWQIIQGLVKV